MKTRMLIAVVVSMFVCQQVYAQDEPEAEVTELEGLWEVVSMVIEGEQEELYFLFVRFEGNSFFLRAHDADWFLAGSIFVDPSSMPAEMAFVFGEGDRSKNEAMAIYEIDDDVLTICSRNPGEIRPEQFESTKDNQTILMVYRRVEEESE